jgi:hypothetical protein
VAAAAPRVLALGATRLDGKEVYADPAGHPFCLIRGRTGLRSSCGRVSDASGKIG